jgi:hypothetical protein
MTRPVGALGAALLLVLLRPAFVHYICVTEAAAARRRP